MDGAQDLAAGEVCDDYTPQQISDQLVLAKATPRFFTSSVLDLFQFLMPSSSCPQARRPGKV